MPQSRCSLNRIKASSKQHKHHYPQALMTWISFLHYRTRRNWFLQQEAAADENVSAHTHTTLSFSGFELMNFLWGCCFFFFWCTSRFWHKWVSAWSRSSRYHRELTNLPPGWLLRSSSRLMDSSTPARSEVRSFYITKTSSLIKQFRRAYFWRLSHHSYSYYNTVHINIISVIWQLQKNSHLSHEPGSEERDEITRMRLNCLTKLDIICDIYWISARWIKLSQTNLILQFGHVCALKEFAKGYEKHGSEWSNVDK